MTPHVLWVLVHSLALVVFINRYVAGLLLRSVRGAKWDEVVDYEPTVTAVIPMFNEGKTVQETLLSLLESDYPHAKLKIICVDDCSTDNSYELAREIARKSNGRLTVMRNRVNMGKRRSIIRAVREADCEVILSVASDVVVDKDAVRQLCRRFTKPEIAAVGGRVDVRNKQDNWLPRMQVVRYRIAYHFSKNRESCGVPIKHGEDRFLTRQVVKAGYLTTMTLTARCRTTVPKTLSSYFSQLLCSCCSFLFVFVGVFFFVW